MTSLPLMIDDEPMGIILRAGQQVLRPAKIWAYCWFLDEGEDGDHTHRHLPVGSEGLKARSANENGAAKRRPRFVFR